MPRSTSIQRSTALGLLALLIIGLAVPAPLLAHAELVSADPLPNASLIDAPDSITITFSEPIDPATAAVAVLDIQLRPLEGVAPVTVDDEGTVARADLPALDPGIYTVSYQVVSTVDGHATTGSFAFVIDPTGAEAPPTGTPTSSSPSVDAWAVAARWLALLGAIVALGTLITWWHAGRATMAAQAPSAEQRPPWRLVIASCAATAVGLALYLALSARPLGDTGGLPFDPAAPFGWTPFAIAMRVSMLAALVAALLALAGATGARGGDQGLVAALAAVCVSLALAGMSAAAHASALGGPLSAAIDWLHLVAAAAWLGGLPSVLVLGARVAAAGGSRRAAAGDMLRRHGRLALVAAPLVVLTGVANSPLVLGTSRELVASAYGNLVLVKAALVSVALGIGAANHLLLRRRGGEGGGIAFLVGAELVIALIAVMAAATMVTIQPSAARQPVVIGPAVRPAHFFGDAGPSSIHASVSVPAPGRQSYQVTVRDAATGAPRPDVQKVFLTFTPPVESDLPPERVELGRAELDGLYTTTGAHTSLVGEWEMEVTVRRTGARDEPVSFSLGVSESGPPLIAPPPDTGAGVPTPLAMLWGVLPGGLAGWLPGLGVLGAFAAVGARSRRMRPLRALLVVVGAAFILAAGSRSLVESANRPSTSELAAYEAAGGSAEAGERIYLANCASCHGTEGAGDGPVRLWPGPEPLEDTVASMSDAEVSYRIAHGLAGTPMPAFAASLTAQERGDLVSYLRQRWGGAP